MQQAKRSAVNVAAGEDVISGLEQRSYAVNGGHARRKSQRTHARLEIGDFDFKRFARGIAATGIVELSPFARTRLNESACQMQRCNDGACLSVAVAANVNRPSTKVHSFLSKGENDRLLRASYRRKLLPQRLRGGV
jgi:hypothetical protein